MIGEVLKTYIIVESNTKIFIIDKHAAHERYLFNQLKAGKDEIDRQVLLSPIAVSLTKDDYSAIIDNIDFLLNYGFYIEDFGSGTVLVREIPVLLAQADISGLVDEIADKLSNFKQDLTPKVIDDLLESIACKGAIRGKEVSSKDELNAIVEMVLKSDDVRYCPHGRPVSYVITEKDLEKQFGRY